MRLALVMVLALTALEAGAQELQPVTEVAPVRPATDVPALEQPLPLIINPDGSMPEGRSVRVAQGQPAPFPGQLIDDQEHTRRARINRAKELEVEKAKQGKVLLPVAGFVAIVASVAVVVAAASVGITVAAQKRPGQP